MAKQVTKETSKRTRQKINFDESLKKHELASESPKQQALRAWQILQEDYHTGKKNILTPGQLVIFNYYEPKTREELEYYDAAPCVLFFGMVDTPLGRRVLGLNIHYYPRKARKVVIKRVLTAFAQAYQKNQSRLQKSPVSNMSYDALKMLLKNVGMGFGVREYIPNLMTNVCGVPVKDWTTAFFTEGLFKKQTKSAIMKYWKQYESKTHVETKKQK